MKWDGYQNLHNQMKGLKHLDECQIWVNSNFQGGNICAGIRSMIGTEQVGPRDQAIPQKLPCARRMASATFIIVVA